MPNIEVIVSGVNHGVATATGGLSAVPVSLGLQGLQGNQGSSGQQGSQGSQGLTGAQGPADGAQGHQGVQGEQGEPGIGVIGPRGNQGATGGAQGNQGHQGHQGFQGTQGVIGTTGVTGATGTQGNQGNTGVTGAQGNQGIQGDKGGLRYVFHTGIEMNTLLEGNIRFNNTGITNVGNIAIHYISQDGANLSGYITSWNDSSNPLDGHLIIKSNTNNDETYCIFSLTNLADNPYNSVFPSGWAVLDVSYVAGTLPDNLENLVVDFSRAGNLGNQGSTGSTGSQGNQGNTGAQGNQGNTGATGAQGNQGNTGVTGAQGNQGSTGAQGNQGNTGATGAQGNQGNTGATGAQGNQGNTGATGAQGNQGNTGATGAQGNQGFQGSTATINNAVENRLLTVAATTTQLDAEQYLTFDGNIFYLGKGFKSEIATITPSAGAVAINMSSEILKKTTLDSNTTFSATSIAAGTSVTLKVLADGTDRTLTFNSSWVFIGQKPVSIAANKTAVLVLTSFGTADTDIIASYTVQD